MIWYEEGNMIKIGNYIINKNYIVAVEKYAEDDNPKINVLRIHLSECVDGLHILEFPCSSRKILEENFEELC